MHNRIFVHFVFNYKRNYNLNKKLQFYCTFLNNNEQKCNNHNELQIDEMKFYPIEN